MMPRFFIAGIALFLLLGAGYGAIQAARATPWDCSDWQAFAHDDRTTAILESLAENRGKTLYCGIDQSDTFAKAETWAAGKDRNERDDTVYWGERGSFRGFIAAQEGWLTDGESGITGQSIATIFEFPRETRRTKKVKRMPIASTGNCPDPATGNGPAGTLACAAYKPPQDTDTWQEGSGLASSLNHAIAFSVGGSSLTGRNRNSNTNPNNNWWINWQTQLVSVWDDRDPIPANRRRIILDTDVTRIPSSEEWTELARIQARRACRAEGYDTAVGVVFGPGHSENRRPNGNAYDRGSGLGWFFEDTWDGDNDGDPNDGDNYRHRARQSRTWEATCKKTIRRTR